MSQRFHDDASLAELRAMLRQLGDAKSPGDVGAWIRSAQADLRRIAHAERLSLRAGETLSTTALVNEAYLRFARADSRFVSREHFYASAARAMRQILVDHSRAQLAQKRGSGLRPESLDEHPELPETDAGVDLLQLDQALDALERALPRPAKVVQLRYFVGLDDREIGALLGVEESTVRRDWLKARGWLHDYLGRSAD